MSEYIYILISREQEILGVYTDELTARDMANKFDIQFATTVYIYEYLTENIDK